MTGWQLRRPTQQQGHAASNVEKTLFLPGIVIAQMVPMVDAKIYQRVFALSPRLDRIDNPPQTLVYMGNLAIVARLEHTSVGIVDVLSPYRVINPGDLLVHVVDRGVATSRIGHAIGIIHTVKRYRWSQW